MLKNIFGFRETREEGFTLVEMMVVVTIIGVVVGAALPILNEQHRLAVRVAMKADLKTAVVAVNTMLTKNTKATNEMYNTSGPFFDLQKTQNNHLSSNKSQIILLYGVSQQQFGPVKRAIFDLTEPISYKKYAIAITNPDGRAIYGYNSTTGKTDVIVEDIQGASDSDYKFWETLPS